MRNKNTEAISSSEVKNLQKTNDNPYKCYDKVQRKDFKILRQIGEGTYGKVYKVAKINTEEIVAIKSIEIESDSGFSITTIREIKMLRILKSEHIVDLIDIFYEKNTIHLILEFIPFDLTGLLQSGYIFTNNQIKSLAFQLISATNHIHKNNFIHRDIKSSNLLITRDGLLKLADFGLTREHCDVMTNRVCTLWYRAPELLLGEHSYTRKIDSWSIGCIIIEMKLTKPPFNENDEISQIKSIFQKFGAPAEQYIWSELLYQMDYIVKDNWLSLIEKNYGFNFEQDFIVLLSKLLMLSPSSRISAEDALNEKIFQGRKIERIPIISEDIHEFYGRKKG